MSACSFAKRCVPVLLILALMPLIPLTVTTPPPLVKACGSCTWELSWGGIGGVGVGMGGFRGLSGVAVDSSSKVYVLDPGYGDDFVQEFTRVGNHMQFDSQFGNQGSGMGQLSGPLGIAVDPSGNIFVADTGNNRVEKFDSNGNFLLAWGCSNATTTFCANDLQGDGELWGPSFLATDSAGNVYVSDPGNQRVQKFDNDGNYITQWGCPHPNSTNFGGGACQAGSLPGEFNGPEGIAVDLSGNVFVVDHYNFRVEKFSDSGMYLGEWGSRGSGPGEFGGPEDLSVDPFGDVYVVDVNETADVSLNCCNNARVEKFGGSGEFLFEFGSQGTGDGQFETPFGIAVDPQFGYTYVTDPCSCVSFRISLFGDLSGGASLATHIAPTPSVGSVSPSCPNGCVETVASTVTVQATPSAGWVFSGWTIKNATCMGGAALNPCEFKMPVLPVNITANFISDAAIVTCVVCTLQQTWGSPATLGAPVGIAADSSGHVYLVDNAGNVKEYTDTGGFVREFGQGTFFDAMGIAVSPSGNVYVTDEGAQNVTEFTSSGSLVRQWGSFGGGDGMFDSPWGIAVASSGNVYVTENSGDRVQEFSSTGAFITKWGSVGSMNGQFSALYGVAVDSAGNVYVADSGNNRVQEFTSNGTYLTQWGCDAPSSTPPACPGGTGEGEFQSPKGIAVDPAGNVYVSDGHRVQKFTSNGAFITQFSITGIVQDVATDSMGYAYLTDYGNGQVDKFGEPLLVITPLAPTPNGVQITDSYPTFQFQVTQSASPVAAAPATVSLNGTQVCAGSTDSKGYFTCNAQVTAAGTYYWNATATEGLLVSSAIMNFITPPSVEAINLYSGWNLISLPVTPSDTAMSTVLATQLAANGGAGDFTMVWSYQNGKWLNAMLSGGKLSGSLATMQDGFGYWIYMTSADTLYVAGYVLLTASAPPSYSLNVAWNLVGFKPQPAVAPETVTAYLTSIAGSYAINSVWLYDNTHTTWVRATPSTQLSPGEAVWVYVTTPTGAVLTP